MIRYYDKIGEMTIRQRDGQEFEIAIHEGNCLAVFVYHYYDDDDTPRDQLYMFWLDIPHVKRMLKSYKTLFSDDVVKCRLNMAAQDAYKILKILVTNGITVECYHEIINNNK